jgi:hypothetical protein
MRAAVLLSLAAAFSIGCASTPPGAKPDDMSTVQHRAEAEKHRDQSKGEEGKYDPNAVAWRRMGGVRAGTLALPDYFYNPTEVHQQRAREHRGHALAHEQAAAALEQFADAECALFEPHTRELCPLLGSIESAQDIQDGVRISVAEGVEPDGLLAHIQCHVAAARSLGREGMDHCPLYLTGVAVFRSSDRTIDLTAGDEATVQELRRRMLEHVSPATPDAVSRAR